MNHVNITLSCSHDKSRWLFLYTAARILDMVCNVAEEARFKDMKKECKVVSQFQDQHL